MKIAAGLNPRSRGRETTAPLTSVDRRRWSDGRDVPIHSTPHRERVGTKQASKKEIRAALSLLQRDPLARAYS